jgi:hypothetical protein
MRVTFAKPRRWGGIIAFSVLALVVAISGLVLVRGGAGAAGTFNPVVDAEVSDDGGGANADITTIFNLPATDYNYKVLVSFTPPGFGPETPDVPIGAKVGTIDSWATLGLMNGACNTPLAPHFDMLWASTDTSDTCTFDEQFDDSGTAGLKKGVVHYPDFLTRMLPGITPLQRLWGWANVSGQLVSVSVVVLEPGTLGYPAAWGSPSMSVLNDIGDPGAAPTPGEAITDFCTKLETTTVVFGLSEDNPDTGGDEAGYEVRRNPTDGGTYTFRWYTESMPDADGDGYETYGDTCPFDVNIDPSFKVVAGHPDQDGIDSVCEIPLGGEAMNCWPGAPGLLNDCDNDGFLNRGDNCPLLANPDQADGDTDDIGDACDPNPTTFDGVVIDLTLEVDVSITAAPEEVEGETTLGEDASAGDTEIDVDDTTGFEEEDTIRIGEEGGETEETNWITGIEGGSAGTFTLLVPLEFDHDAGEPVVKIEAVPTPTPTAEEGTPTPTPEEGEGTPTPEATATPTPEVEVDICTPVFPGTYNGFVRIDGQPASGYRLTASIDDIEWGSAIVTGGRYAMEIPDHLPTAEPDCFKPGTITFELNGMTCSPSPDWKDGIQNVDLTCAPAAPVATPTPEEATPTATPATPTATPAGPPPSGAGGLSGSSSGLPLWAMALASWAGLTIVAGLGTLVAAKRR